VALTTYGVNNSLAVKLWAKKLFVEALKQCWFNRFMGENSSAMIQKLTDTQKGPGDQVTFGLRMQLSGDGVLGDGTLEGNEEALTTYSDALVINQLRHAVRNGGRMSQERVPFSVRDEALSGLKDWWSDRLDYAFINHLTANTAITDIRYTGGNAIVAADASHILLQKSSTVTNPANEAALDSTCVFTLSTLDRAVAAAKTLSPAIRPIRVDGNDKFVAILHPYQVFQLRTNTNSGQWLDIQKAAMTGGQISDNPIYTGALGEYNNTILFESARIPTTTTSVRRAVFAGAQAGVVGFGSISAGSDPFYWVEELFDYGNQLGVSAGTVFGVKKTRFNSADFGTLTMASYSPAP
jgi:N4-gp56 family major capsid protein